MSEQSNAQGVAIPLMVLDSMGPYGGYNLSVNGKPVMHRPYDGRDLPEIQQDLGEALARLMAFGSSGEWKQIVDGEVLD